MRTVALALVVSGCASTIPETRTIVVQSQRVLLGPAPMAPQALSGSSGIGLTGQVMAGEAVETGPGSGVAFSRVQPNVGTVFQVDRWYVGGHFSFASPTFGTVHGARAAADVSGTQFAWETVVLLGRDFAVTERFGFNLAAELGLVGASFRNTSTLGSGESQFLYPALRGGGGVWGTPHPALRLFGGLAVNTTPWNTPTSTVTQTCSVTCNTSDTGVVAYTGVGLVGGGVRWQAVKGVSIGAELWVPFTSNSAGIPPQISVTLRLGDFVFTPSANEKRLEQLEEPLTPPPPPPFVEPAPPPLPQGV